MAESQMVVKGWLSDHDADKLNQWIRDLSDADKQALANGSFDQMTKLVAQSPKTLAGVPTAVIFDRYYEGKYRDPNQQDVTSRT